MVSNGETQGKKKRGRPSKYTSEIAARICDRITQGESLRSICKTPGMPSPSQVCKWLNAYSEFSGQYARAREAAGDAAYEDIVEIERQLKDKQIDAHTARVLIDSIKWRASKLKPQLYGDHQQVLIGGGLKVASRDLVDGAPQWIKERIAKTTSAGPGAELGAGIAAGIAATNPSKTKH